MGEADPSQPVQFSELPNRGMQPAGKRLDGRAASWLPGRWNGSATSLTFDEGLPIASPILDFNEHQLAQLRTYPLIILGEYHT